jgi:hypothetical protein
LSHDLFLVPSPNGYPSQQYSSSQPSPAHQRRSTHPTAPTHEHASSFPRQPAPPPSGSVSHYARYASTNFSSPPLPMTQPPNIAQSMPSSYDMSPYPPSRSEMSGGPHPSQSSSYRACSAYISSVSFLTVDVNEGEDDSRDSSSGRNLERRQSPVNTPIAGNTGRISGENSAL